MAVFDKNIQVLMLKGEAANIEIGDVATVPSNQAATVTNSGTTGDAVFDFEIPQGKAATIAVGTVTTGEPGTNANITNSGTTDEAVFNFVIPRGDKGEKGDKGDKGDTVSAAWGTMTGTITDQTDLVSYVTNAITTAINNITDGDEVSY